MNNNFNESLQEVWDMKEKVYNDFKLSNFTNFNDFIEEEMKELREKYDYKYYKPLEFVEA